MNLILTPTSQVEAVLDPLSAGAQQISQILHVLYSANLITLRIVLNPVGMSISVMLQSVKALFRTKMLFSRMITLFEELCISTLPYDITILAHHLISRVSRHSYSPERLSEMPVKRFYRYVLEPELSFTGSGEIAEIGSR